MIRIWKLSGSDAFYYGIFYFFRRPFVYSEPVFLWGGWLFDLERKTNYSNKLSHIPERSGLKPQISARDWLLAVADPKGGTITKNPDFSLRGLDSLGYKKIPQQLTLCGILAERDVFEPSSPMCSISNI